MKVKDICEKLGLKLLGGAEGLDRDAQGVYICDLLSWVMSHGFKGNVWITVQTHSNIIAVASLLDMSCIIIPEEIEVEADTVKKADEEGIPLLVSNQSAFDISKILIELGVGK